MPKVGDRVVLRYPEPNINNWACAGVVRAIVDDCVIVVRRWLPRRRYHVYELIDQCRWDIFDPDRPDATGGLLLLPAASAEDGS